MSYRSTAAVMDAIATRIEALVPSPQFAADDMFRASCDLEQFAQSGHRAVLVEGVAGVRKPGSNRNCNEWVAAIGVTVAYTVVPVEAGQPSILQRAIQDAEDILADLYLWAANDADIYLIEPDQATPQIVGDGELHISRTIRVYFLRS